MHRQRKPKRQFSPKSRRAECGCTAQNGEPKTLFPEKYIASRTAGDTMARGKVWEIYRCRERRGWHIATVRYDPWSRLK